MYYSAIGLLAVLILIIENQDILYSHRDLYHNPVWRFYGRFLVAVLAYYTTDILWGIFESRKMAALLFADTTVYYVAMGVGILCWAQYIVAYMEEHTPFGRFLVYTGRILAGLITLLSIVNIFVPVLFTVDRESVYHALPVRYILLTSQILLLILISIYAISAMLRKGNGTGKCQRYRTLAVFGMIMALFLFIQLWFPYLPLYTVALLLGTILLHTFVTQDEREEHRRGVEEAEKVTELKETITSLMDNMPGMTFSKEASTGVYLACNQAFAEYARKESPEGVVGQTDAQLFSADTAAHFAADDKIALAMTQPYIYYEDILDAAGGQRQFQTAKLKYKDTSGKICVLGICQDVTDMVRIQHENAMTKEAYESAVSSGLMYTHIAQTLTREYTDMFYVNTDTEEYIEYSSMEGSSALTEKRRGWHFFSDCRAELGECVYDDDREMFLRALQRKTLMKALDRKNTFIMTYRQISDGEPVYVSMKVSRMENDEKYIIIGIMNVNAQMRDAMAKSEALAEALSAAEQANKAKTSFLSNMSHEIRTPMNAIIGLDTIALKKDSLDAETRGYLEKIGESARHLLALINDILDMSRIESGHVVLRREAFSMHSLLEQVNAVFAPRCRDKGLSYECRVLGRMEDAFIGDEMKLKEVLVNLLSNAVKFTEAPGSVTLIAEQTAEFEEQATVRFRIRDTGIGMDQEYLSRIFEPFSQEDGSRKTKYGSTGLGLAITKRIVEMMNGSVDVETEKGTGSEFTVIITLKSCTRQDIGEEDVIDLQELRILVVDDDPIEAEHARMVLEEVGIRADMCTGGEEALRLMEAHHAAKEPYNLVLMDWNMPGMNGLEASAEIRKLYDNESTVVVLTAYDWDDIEEEARRVGVDSFLAKPLCATHVIEQFEKIARRNRITAHKEKKRAKLAGRRLLLAEDMEINAEIMKYMLEMEHIKADYTENGKLAVEMFENNAPGTYAAILMDIRMPEMDGLEAAEAIRAMDREDAKRIPIIALTANAFDEDVQRSLQAGMNAHLSKPVEADHLFRILGELIWKAEETN